MSIASAAPRLISDFRQRRPIRGKSLIITLFGDVVSQHGGTLWLGSLIDSLKLLGASEHLTRTSAFRLVQDGWLESDMIGRRSYYRFSDYGQREYSRAAERIYGAAETAWLGEWQLVLLLTVAEDTIGELRRSLAWLGFRPLTGLLYAKPGAVSGQLRRMIEEFGVRRDVLIMQGNADQASSLDSMRDMVSQKWRLPEVRERYTDFHDRYAFLARESKSRNRLFSRPEIAFTLRLMLIHDYRRLLLTDTALPQELMGGEWPAIGVRQLTGQLYRALTPASLEYIGSEMTGCEGRLPQQPGAAYFDRFGGIQR